MIFSSRTNWLRHPNNLSLLLDQRRKRGEVIYDLTVSNPTECGIVYPQQEILSAISSPEVIHYRPDPRGFLPAREAVCRFYQKNNIDLYPSQIVLTASSSEAYSMIFKLLCNTGESVLVPRPSYPLFEFLAELNDIALQYYRLNYDHGWHIDIESMTKGCSSGTKAIIVVNPHNPTGMFVKRSEHVMIEELAARHHCALIADEVFIDYGFSEDRERVGSTADSSTTLTLTLNGISKMLGLPQMKLGWIVVGGESVVVSEVLERLEIISDTFLSVNTPVQAALATLLDVCRPVQDRILERVKSNYSFLQSHSHRATGATGRTGQTSALACEGGWYAVLRVPRTRTDEEWALQLLEQIGVYVQPGYFFDFEEEGFLVVSLLVEEEIFRQGVEKLMDFVDSEPPPAKSGPGVS